MRELSWSYAKWWLSVVFRLVMLVLEMVLVMPLRQFLLWSSLLVVPSAVLMSQTILHLHPSVLMFNLSFKLRE